MTVFTDPNYQKLVPEKKNPIRGECYVSFDFKINNFAFNQVGGWSMEPVNGDKNKSKLTLMIELDLKGNIPQAILKTANKDQGF